MHPTPPIHPVPPVVVRTPIVVAHPAPPPIDHDAPKDLGWASNAIHALDARLQTVEVAAPVPVDVPDFQEQIDALTSRVAALEALANVSGIQENAAQET
jgi:hypothetical protein